MSEGWMEAPGASRVGAAGLQGSGETRAERPGERLGRLRDCIEEGRHGEAEQALEALRVEARQGGDLRGEVEALGLLAGSAAARGDHERAQPLYAAAVALADRLAAEGGAERPAAHLRLGAAFSALQLGCHDEARRLLEAARQAGRRLGEPEVELTAARVLLLGAQLAGDLYRALRAAGDLMVRAEELRDEEHSALALQALDRMAVRRPALRLARALRAGRGREARRALVELGEALSLAGRHEAALRACRDALRLARQAPSSGRAPHELAERLVDVGTAAWELGRTAEALAAFDEALRCCRRPGGEVPRERAARKRGLLLLAERRFPEAAESLIESLMLLPEPLDVPACEVNGPFATPLEARRGQAALVRDALALARRAGARWDVPGRRQAGG